MNDTRNELERAQGEINKLVTQREFIDTKMLSNPIWRQVNKKNWVSPSKSFDYRRPDNDVNKLKARLNLSENDPYVDKKDGYTAVNDFVRLSLAG